MMRIDSILMFAEASGISNWLSVYFFIERANSVNNWDDLSTHTGNLWQRKGRDRKMAGCKFIRSLSSTLKASITLCYQFCKCFSFKHLFNSLVFFLLVNLVKKLESCFWLTGTIYLLTQLEPNDEDSLQFLSRFKKGWAQLFWTNMQEDWWRHVSKTFKSQGSVLLMTNLLNLVVNDKKHLPNLNMMDWKLSFTNIFHEPLSKHIWY